MNIFEEIDRLINKKSIIKESKESDEKIVPTIKDAPDMQTSEQGKLQIRDIFRRMLEGGGGMPPMGPEPPEPPKKIEGVKTPNPFKTKGGSGVKSRDWEEDELVWDDDELEKMKLGEDEGDDDEFDDDSDFYDDFEDERGGGDDGDDGDGDGDGDDEDPIEEPSGEDDDDTDDPFGEEKEGEDADKDPIGKHDKKEEVHGGKKSKGEKSDDGDDGDGDGEDDDEDPIGEPTETDDKKEGHGGKKTKGDKDAKDSDATKTLKNTINDAIEKLKERSAADKEKLEKLTEMTEEGTSEKEIDDLNKELESEKSDKINGVKDLIGRTEDAVSKEDIKKEIDAAKVSDEDKETLSDLGEKAVEAPPTPLDDAEMTKLKRKAITELEKKCKGNSSLSKEILYHAMKDAEIKDEDWKTILEQILKSKSKHTGVEDSKVKKNTWGNKNHLWRNAVLPGKTERIGGSDTQSIYCFVDYSGSVRCMTRAIISFLGKVMELCINLQYTQVYVYTFAEKLSLPKKITKDMIDKDGYERVLSSVIEFFEEPANYVGEAIEDFSLVASEINNIKHKDKDAVAFVFGDGMWTFYGNTQPPIRLKELCPRWLKDICFFVFYRDISERLKKEISYFSNEVGIKNIITTELTSLKETFSD